MTFQYNLDNYAVTDSTTHALKLFRVGNGLDDEQLDLLLDFFGVLEGSLTALGPQYHLATIDARRKLDTLLSFKLSRLG